MEGGKGIATKGLETKDISDINSGEQNTMNINFGACDKGIAIDIINDDASPNKENTDIISQDDSNVDNENSTKNKECINSGEQNTSNIHYGASDKGIDKDKNNNDASPNKEGTDIISENNSNVDNDNVIKNKECINSSEQQTMKMDIGASDKGIANERVTQDTDQISGIHSQNNNEVTTEGTNVDNAGLNNEDIVQRDIDLLMNLANDLEINSDFGSEINNITIGNTCQDIRSEKEIHDKITNTSAMITQEPNNAVISEKMNIETENITKKRKNCLQSDNVRKEPTRFSKRLKITKKLQTCGFCGTNFGKGKNIKKFSTKCVLCCKDYVLKQHCAAKVTYDKHRLKSTSRESESMSLSLWNKHKPIFYCRECKQEQCFICNKHHRRDIIKLTCGKCKEKWCQTTKQCIDNHNSLVLCNECLVGEESKKNKNSNKNNTKKKTKKRKIKRNQKLIMAMKALNPKMLVVRT